MLGVVYLGTNERTEGLLKYLPGRMVKFTTNYKDASTVCTTNIRDEHFILFYERSVRNEDITAITYLRRKCANIYIILLTGPMKSEDRIMYQKCGIDDTLTNVSSIAEINDKINFINDREELFFGHQEPLHKILHFKIPIWKRYFDIAFSLCAIIVLSPVFLFTALAIRLESKGPILYKSKRVGTNYKIFDFLKFRSMYVDADKRLKDYNNKNQYAQPDIPQTTSITAPLGQQAEQNAINQGLDSVMMISDDETMLVGDDFVVAESDFYNKKNEEIKNAFVKIENDPRVTKVGHVIRKYSIDELPQLINILRGDMSVVGNRPLPLYEAEKLTTDECIDRFMAPAGLTGLWQVEKRGDSGKMSAEERKQLDIKYGQNYNFKLDMKIIFKTLTAFIQKEDV